MALSFRSPHLLTQLSYALGPRMGGGGFSATGNGAPGVGPGVRLWVSYPETSTEGSRAAEICTHLRTFVCASFPGANPLPTPPPTLVPGLPSPSPGGSSGGPSSHDGALAGP